MPLSTILVLMILVNHLWILDGLLKFVLTSSWCLRIERLVLDNFKCFFLTFVNLICMKSDLSWDLVVGKHVSHVCYLWLTWKH